MKHIKKFENIDNDMSYWLVPSDERLSSALLKLKCDLDFISNLVTNTNVKKGKYLFVRYNKKGKSFSINPNWGWNDFEGSLYSAFYEEEGYTFKGTIMITDDELDYIKVMKDSNKYNI